MIAGGLLMAAIVDRVGMERVLACGLAFGACCVLAIGAFDPPFWLLAFMLCGAGIGGGCQGGINALSGLCLPTGDTRDRGGLGAWRGTRRGHRRTTCWPAYCWRSAFGDRIFSWPPLYRPSARRC